MNDYFGVNIGPVWVTFDPSTGSAGHATQTIYVGLADTQTSIYKSVDGGATWEPVAGQPKQRFLPRDGTLGSNGMLYVSYNSALGPFDAGNGAVWKLGTKTGEWTDISPGGAGDTSNPYGGLAVVSIDPKLVRGSRLSSTASVELQVGIVDASTLPGEVRNKLGGSRMLDLSLTVDGKPVTKFDGNDISVAIGYKLKDGEKPNRVALYYLNDYGKLEIINNAKYNPKTGNVEFKAKQQGRRSVRSSIRLSVFGRRYRAEPLPFPPEIQNGISS